MGNGRPRIIISYLVAGLFGTLVGLFVQNGIDGGMVLIGRVPWLYGLTMVAWPLILFGATFGNNPPVRVATLYVFYLAPGLLAFLLLSMRIGTPKAKGLCPTCGYDLRATPSRCPECGTVVANAITESTEDTEVTEKKD